MLAVLRGELAATSFGGEVYLAALFVSLGHVHHLSIVTPPSFLGTTSSASSEMLAGALSPGHSGWVLCPTYE
jgi:hypothetical protein